MGGGSGSQQVFLGRGGLLHKVLLRGQEDTDWDFNTVVLMILGSTIMDTLELWQDQQDDEVVARASAT